MEKVYQRALSVNLHYSFWRDRQFSFQETFIFSRILFQERYVTFTEFEKRTIPEKMLQMYLYTHLCAQCMDLFLCLHSPREVTEPSQGGLAGYGHLTCPDPETPSKSQMKNPEKGSWMLSPRALLSCLISAAPLSQAGWELLPAPRSLSHHGGYFSGKEEMPTSWAPWLIPVSWYPFDIRQDWNSLEQQKVGLWRLRFPIPAMHKCSMFAMEEYILEEFF